MRPPVPLIAIGSWTVPVRLMTSVPLLVTAPVPIAPVLPPLPMFSVPPAIVVGPV